MRTCSKCKETKENYDFSGKHNYWCRECRTKEARAKNPKPEVIDDGMRTCSHCKTRKPVSEFYNNTISWCIECRRVHSRERYDSKLVDANLQKRMDAYKATIPTELQEKIDYAKKLVERASAKSHILTTNI